jgi:hypothetical protein
VAAADSTPAAAAVHGDAHVATFGIFKPGRHRRATYCTKSVLVCKKRRPENTASMRVVRVTMLAHPQEADSPARKNGRDGCATGQAICPPVAARPRHGGPDV